MSDVLQVLITNPLVVKEPIDPSQRGQLEKSGALSNHSVSGSYSTTLEQTGYGWESKKMKAIIFINIYCIFDTVDNINAKVAMGKGVAVIDLTLARILLNFVSACLFVVFCGQSVIAGVPPKFKRTLTYRSFMLLLGQALNVFSISLLPLSLITILQNT